MKKKQDAGMKNIHTLRHAMTLAQEVEFKLKKYQDLNDDDPSVMQISTVLVQFMHKCGSNTREK